MTPDFWERFVLLSQRAGKYIALYSECQPAMVEFQETGCITPEWREKVDIALRGMEHFMPFVEKFREFMIAVEETPMELVDPEVLQFLDSL